MRFKMRKTEIFTEENSRGNLNFFLTMVEKICGLLEAFEYFSN